MHSKDIFGNNVSLGTLKREYDRFVIDFAPGKHFEGEPLGAPASLKEGKKILFVLLSVFFLILSRLFFLQIMKGPWYRSLAEENRTRMIPLFAARGAITDVFEKPLVENIPQFVLLLQPQDLPVQKEEKEATLQRLALLIGMPYEDLRKKIEGSFIPVEITELDSVQAEKFMIQEAVFPGAHLEVRPGRQYLYGSSLFHVLGYLRDGKGVNGIEGMYNDILQGTDGKQEVEVNAQGKEQRLLGEEAAVAGEDIVLSLDIDLQNKIYEVVSRIAQEKNATGATAVALDPRDGAIRALVSFPSGDSNAFTRGLTLEEQNVLDQAQYPLFFRAVAGQYPPGSTFKPFVAAAALQENIITEFTTFLSTGGLQINAWFFPDWKAGGHGITDLRKAIADSVNTFFYLVGGGDNASLLGLGVDRIRSYASLFGFGEKLGANVSGEASGFLPTKSWKEEVKGESWYIGDTYHLAIGQGDVLVTPLQLAAAYASVVNSGTLYKPYLIEAEKEVIRENVAEGKNLRIIREGLRQTVTDGSAKLLQSLPVKAAGKTGTAQNSTENNPHSWMVSFAPYESPELVLVVLIENGGESTAAALPASKEILDSYFKMP